MSSIFKYVLNLTYNVVKKTYCVSGEQNAFYYSLSYNYQNILLATR